MQRRAGGNEPKRGDAICISMENYPQGKERPGASFDRGILDLLFKMLYFDVEWLVDTTNLKHELKKIAEKLCKGTSDCFVCFVSAHGNTDKDGHYIIESRGSGSKVYVISDILEPFMTCEELKGIPKVFFINACRGEYQSTDSVVDYVKKNGKDSLVVFSTEEGNASWRYPKDGTLFVKALHEAIYLNSEKEDVAAMVTIANNMLRRDSEASFRGETGKKVWCQVAPSHSNLTGKLYWRKQGPSDSAGN